MNKSQADLSLAEVWSSWFQEVKIPAPTTLQFCAMRSLPMYKGG